MQYSGQQSLSICLVLDNKKSIATTLPVGTRIGQTWNLRIFENCHETLKNNDKNIGFCAYDCYFVWFLCKMASQHSWVINVEER